MLTFYASLSSDWDSCKPDTKEFYMRDIYSWIFVADMLQYNHERNYLLPNKR
jgi:hypothetical protein